MADDEAMESDDATDLLANLEQCYEITLSTLTHSLKEGGDFVKEDHIRLIMDCSSMCNMAISFLIRDSEYAGDILNTCAFICEDCAESCREFFEDEKMRNCANVCDNCAEACRNMVTDENDEEIVDESEDENDEKE